MPKKEQEGKWFLKTHEILYRNGYQAYEVSNFSKPGYECNHNLHYWNIEPYLAFGPSAHGFDGQYRWNNSRSLDQYTSCVLAGKSAISMREKISTLEGSIASFPISFLTCLLLMGQKGKTCTPLASLKPFH